MRLIDADLLGLTDMEIFMCNGDYKEALKMLLDKIEHAPAIDPDPSEEDEELDFVQKHKKLPIILETRDKAHWIEVGREEGALGIEYKCYRCSKCGWESSLPIPRNFCPECGSDMKGEQDGT